MKKRRCFTNLVSIFIILLLSLNVFAQNKKSKMESVSVDRSSDKIDLEQLEKKYWSAKDDDYGVIQNRTYSKSEKIYGSIVTGTLINDTFADAKPLGYMFGYYLNEDFGLELSYFQHNANKNSSVETLNKTNIAVSPNYNLIRNSQTLSLVYTPFYAKMAFMNKAIMYFDMGFSLGLGNSTYDQVTSAGTGLGDQYNSQSASHFEIGFLQQLFINKNFALRIDLKNTFYKQEVKAYQINGNTGSSSENKNANDTTLTFGLTLFQN